MLVIFGVKYSFLQDQQPLLLTCKVNLKWKGMLLIFLKITSSMSYKNSCFQNVKEEKDHAEDTSLKVVKYARTPVMSTYLVAFVVGEFDFVEGSNANGVTIRVYTPKGREVRGQFALEVSLARCITNFCQVTLISTITLLNVCLNVCCF